MSSPKTSFVSRSVSCLLGPDANGSQAVSFDDRPRSATTRGQGCGDGTIDDLPDGRRSLGVIRHALAVRRRPLRVGPCCPPLVVGRCPSPVAQPSLAARRGPRVPCRRPPTPQHRPLRQPPLVIGRPPPVVVAVHFPRGSKAFSGSPQRWVCGFARIRTAAKMAAMRKARSEPLGLAERRPSPAFVDRAIRGRAVGTGENGRL